ncbi:zinc finger MYND domain-containing protein 10 [Diabrotica virgifera virgifera]|uniref:Zinc finger MYND domain-containing protein 10 n=1 Tax=Diabrotica virgifera virgifera TaxID=50390 RepID=A0A6P7F4E5_DIAVI|nr:zinc finger MYND domain-containing protein 10 [Diabrotica virgifera virgifera]
MDSLLLPNEIELYVDTMCIQKIENLGSYQWIEWHHRLQKLNQEALIEALEIKEEHVKETLVCFGKVPLLVHEAILISIWKQKVLPELLKLEPYPENTFIAYSVLYHEAVCVALLELVLFHPNCCETLGDVAADLLEYSTANVSQLLTITQTEPDLSETTAKQLIRQKHDLSFEIGIRSLAIIRYLSESLDTLPVSVKSKMYADYDVPVLFTEIIIRAPWYKDGKVYVGGKWKKWDNEQLSQYEGQAWLTIRQLLLDPECSKYYALTDKHRTMLSKLLPRMIPTLLDQLSPLIELQEWLSRFNLMEENHSDPKPLLIETVLDIKESILNQTGRKWKSIAQKQVHQIFTNDKETLQAIAGRLSNAYNTELLEMFEAQGEEKCARCENNASKRCSRCHNVWYCSRECQVEHWNIHKERCQSTS